MSSFDQVLSLPKPPEAHDWNAKGSSLAAGEAQVVTAKTYHWKRESLLRSGSAQGIGGSEKRGAGTATTPFDEMMNGRSAIICNVLGLPLSKHFQNTPDIVLYAQAIRQALQADRVSAARNIFSAIPPALAVDPGLGSIGHVLALPVVHSVVKHDTDRSKEFEWLRTEGHKYHGQWVAVEKSQLLVSAPTLKALRSQLKINHQDRFPLIHRVV